MLFVEPTGKINLEEKHLSQKLANCEHEKQGNATLLYGYSDGVPAFRTYTKYPPTIRYLWAVAGETLTDIEPHIPAKKVACIRKMQEIGATVYTPCGEGIGGLSDAQGKTLGYWSNHTLGLVTRANKQWVSAE